MQLKLYLQLKLNLRIRTWKEKSEILLSLILKVFPPLKEVDDHEEFISVNEIDKIINNLGVKKVPGTDQAIKKLIKH